MSADTPEPVTGQSTDTPEPVTGQTGTTDEPRAKSAGEAASSPAGESAGGAAGRPAGESGGRVGLAARRQARWQARRAARTGSEAGRGPEAGGGPEADQASARGVDWVSLGAVVLLLGAAGATHGAVFGDTSGYTAVAGGIALGSLIGLAGARWRWSLLETLLATTLTYLLAGGALALPATTTSRLVPTLATLQGLVTGAVEAWKDLLTLSPPAGAFVGPAIVPYLAGLLASVTAVTTALRTTRRQAWALVPVAALGLVGVLWGSQNAPLALPAAGTVLATGLLWTSWLAHRRRREAGRGIVGSPTGQGRRWLTVAGSLAMVAVALVASALAAPVLQGGEHRDVLRDHVRPPLDLEEYASPLTSFHYWVDNQKDATLFTVTGLKEGERIRLATLDAYDGVVMRVGTGQGSDSFYRTGTTVTDDALPEDATTSTLGITIKDYSGYWMPGGGELRTIDVTSADSAAIMDGLYYSSSLGSALTTRGLSSGDSYTVTLVTPPVWSDQQLTGRAGSTLVQPELTNVPDGVGERLSEAVGEADTPVSRVRAMQQFFSTQGYFSNGSDGLSLPSHSTARLESLLDVNAAMIGDDEQYAVAMALMARQAGYPSRVVMGFYPQTYSEGEQRILGTDAHVWVEVSFDGAGWVPFDPTPPRDRTPQTEVPRPKPNPRPQVLQPPVPPQEPAELPPDITDDHDRDTDDASAWRYWLLLAARLAGGLLVVSSPFLVVVGLKARRRHRRRTGGTGLDQVGGGWDELIDRATDLGTGVPRSATRPEQARFLQALTDGRAQVPGSVFRPQPAPGSVGALAVSVDGSVFGGADASHIRSEQVWEDADAVLARLRAATRRRRRVLAVVALRSLRAGRRERRTRRRAERRAAGRTRRPTPSRPRVRLRRPHSNRGRS